MSRADDRTGLRAGSFAFAIVLLAMICNHWGVTARWVLVLLGLFCVVGAMATMTNRPTTTYYTDSSDSSTASASCISAWDYLVGRDEGPTFSPPTNQALIQPGDLAGESCDDTLIGEEHQAQLWLAGAVLVGLIAAGNLLIEVLLVIADSHSGPQNH